MYVCVCTKTTIKKMPKNWNCLNFSLLHRFTVKSKLKEQVKVPISLSYGRWGCLRNKILQTYRWICALK